MKTYVLTLSKYFSKNHNKSGFPTHFQESFILGTGCKWKSHTNLTHPGKYFRPSKVKIMRPTSPK